MKQWFYNRKENRYYHLEADDAARFWTYADQKEWTKVHSCTCCGEPAWQAIILPAGNDVETKLWFCKKHMRAWDNGELIKNK